MATRRIKDITNTATTFASDDFIALDGATQGTRKMDKDDLIAEVSAGVSGDYLEEANNLSDVASLDTSKLNMEIPDVGTAPNEVPLNGMLGDMAYQSSDGVSVAKLEVTDSVTDSLTIENDTAPTLYFERAGIPNAHIKAVDETGTEGGGIQLYSSEVRLRTGGTQHVTLDSSGRLGIGTDSPGSYNADADDLVVGAAGTGNRGLTIASGSTNYGVIYFADGTTGNQQYRGAISYNHNIDALSLGTVGATRWYINNSGHLVANQSGNGIDFGSAATSAGQGTGTTGSPANSVLSDYEFGSWTPTFKMDGTNFAALTMDVLAAQYVKVGRHVHCQAFIRTDTVDTTGASGNLMIDGLPFVADTTASNFAGLTVHSSGSWVNAPATGYVFPNTAIAYLTRGGTTGTNLLTASDVTNGAVANRNSIAFTVSYIAST
jgi:hypothetical protein